MEKMRGFFSREGENEVIFYNSYICIYFFFNSIARDIESSKIDL